jgi:UDP-2-acetamido-3-amino-2,3-dideoxy-glucuronate N-acetyltransferase
MDFYSHPNALVESEVIGARSRIWAFAHVLPGARIGTDAIINQLIDINGLLREPS